MPFEVRVLRRVEFSETDMAGIMHFSNFFRYMETAEHAFLRSVGFSVVLSKTHPGLCLPRVHAECDYMAPLQFEDEVEVHLLVSAKTRRTLSYQFRFKRLDGDEPQLVARGLLTVVCATRQPDGALKAVSLPEEFARRIDVAPPAMLELPRRTINKKAI